MGKYDYLKKYIIEQDNKKIDNFNRLRKVKDTKFSDLELILGFEFPSQLKEFWLEIGYGVIRANNLGIGSSTLDNRILTPHQIADILLSDPDSPDCPVIYEFYEYLTEGDMPFFEIGDSVSFLYMRPKSDKPNVVYDSLGEIVANSFEEFVYRLYHESPTFYSDNWGPKLDS